MRNLTLKALVLATVALFCAGMAFSAAAFAEETDMPSYEERMHSGRNPNVMVTAANPTVEEEMREAAERHYHDFSVPIIESYTYSTVVCNNCGVEFDSIGAWAEHAEAANHGSYSTVQHFVEETIGYRCECGSISGEDPSDSQSGNGQGSGGGSGSQGGGLGGNGSQGGGFVQANLEDYAGVAAASEHPDLVATDWYMKVPDGAFRNTAVLYLDYTLGRGLMSGYSDGSNRFDPWGAMKRGMAITVIYRMAEGKTAANTDNVNVDTPFADVRSGDWYAAAAAWGYENGITTGYKDGSNHFGPDDLITREQLVTMIARYCESQGMAESDKNVSMFNDSGKINDWALDGVAFCYKHEIVSGIGGTNNFAPGEVAQRAQMSKIIAATAHMLESRA